MPIPVFNPQVDGGAIDFQGLGDLAGRLAFIKEGYTTSIKFCLPISDADKRARIPTLKRFVYDLYIRA